MSETLLSQDAEGVRTLTFNRPEKKNAFTHAMYESATEALLKAGMASTVRVVLLTGAGNPFTAGNDIGDFLDKPPAGEDSAVFRFLRTLVNHDKPVVAAVD